MPGRMGLLGLPLLLFGLILGGAHGAGRSLRRVSKAESAEQQQRRKIFGVDFGTSDPDEYSSAMSSANAGAITDEFGETNRDEMLPPAPKPAPRHTIGSDTPVNVGEYADAQNGILEAPNGLLSPSSAHRVVIPSPTNTRGPAGVQQYSLAALAKGTEPRRILGGPSGATPESDATDSAQLSMAPLPQANTTNKKASLLASKKVVAEYDLGVSKEAQDADEAEQTQEDGAVSDGERMTKEDIRRLAKKDGVTKLKVGRKASNRRLIHLRRGISSERVVVPRGRRHSGVPRGSAKSTSQAQLHSSVGSKGEAQAVAPGPEKMKGQCMSFASYLKTQDIQGIELVRVWKSTCDPAVMEGTATPPYQLMCNSLGGAVEEFANQPGWDPGAVCDAVIRVFNEAGIGTLR